MAAARALLALLVTLPPPAAALRSAALAKRAAGNGSDINITELFMAYCGGLRSDIQRSLGWEADRTEDFLSLLQRDGASSEEAARAASNRTSATSSLTSATFRVGKTDVAVVLSDGGDMSWIGTLSAGGFDVKLRPQEGGDAAIAQVRQLLDFHDSGDEMLVLLHGNPLEQNRYQPAGLVEYVAQIDAAKVDERGGYASLNFLRSGRANSAQQKLLEYRMDCAWPGQVWVKLLRYIKNIGPVGAFVNNKGYYCCSQFVVTKKAVHQYPRVFYETLLEEVTKPQPWGDNSWKSLARTLAALWHTIFTGQVGEPLYSYHDIASCPASGCHARSPGPRLQKKEAAPDATR